jgi:hypothetical protein
LDEDRFPVGGFASVSNRGGIESLLHSQLAYMEDADDGRPDLFDVKHLRDELLYYSRDENQLLRRRRDFSVVFAAALTQARFKDPELPCQRVLLALAGVVTVVRQLSRWLSLDALRFRLAVPDALKPERELLQLVLWDEIERGIVDVDVAAAATADAAGGPRLVVAWHPSERTGDALEWAVGGDRPVVRFAGPDQPEPARDDPMDSWHKAVAGVVSEWIS